MPIGEVLEKAFKYPWKNRALWFYGVLLAIFSAGSGLSNQYQYKEGDFTFLEKINPAIIFIVGGIIVLVIFVFSIIGIIISSWSQVAICKGTVMLEEGKEITRKEIGKTGKRPVWKLIILDVFIPVMIAIVLLLVIGALIALFCFMPQPAGMWIGITVGILFLIFGVIPLAVYWGLVWVMAVRYVALEEMKAFQALGAARKLIKGKFWWTFLLSIVQGMITGMASMIALLPLVLLGGGAVLLVIAKIYIGAVIVGLLALLYLLLYIVICGYFVAFQNVGWTIWWLKLKEQKAGLKTEKPKIVKKVAK